MDVSLFEYLYRTCSSWSPQGSSGYMERIMVRVARRPATELGALCIHLLSSHTRDIPHLFSPPCPDNIPETRR